YQVGMEQLTAMSDTSPKDKSALTWDHIPTKRTEPVSVGVEVWRLTREGHVMCCELRNDSGSGAGWEVVLKLDGEWLLGRRCEDEGFAKFVANGMKQDHLHGGWTEA